MSDLKDFVIENGVLKKYVGTDANVTISEEVFQIGPNAFKNNKNIVCVTLSDKLTIKAIENSYAEKFAKKNRIPFVAE